MLQYAVRSKHYAFSCHQGCDIHSIAAQRPKNANAASKLTAHMTWQREVGETWVVRKPAVYYLPTKQKTKIGVFYLKKQRHFDIDMMFIITLV